LEASSGMAHGSHVRPDKSLFQKAEDHGRMVGEHQLPRGTRPSEALQTAIIHGMFYPIVEKINERARALSDCVDGGPIRAQDGRKLHVGAKSRDSCSLRRALMGLNPQLPRARWERAHRLLLRRRRSFVGRRFAHRDRFHPSFLEYFHQPVRDVPVLAIFQQPGGESEAVWSPATAATTTTARGTCRSGRAASACGVVGAAPVWI
jgi:hypothetical protein